MWWMAMLFKIKCRWLRGSPATSHKNIMLELLGAWKPLYSSKPSLVREGKESRYSVSSGNKAYNWYMGST